jgi:3-oxoacyl-[acyl-carrier-protein] synthase-1
MPGEERHIITAMGVSSALGDSLEATWQALLSAQPRVSAPPFELPFATVCGAVQGPLDALPARFSAHDTRLTRILARALSQVTAPVERARARYGRERVAVLVGSSTGGLDTTEDAYRNLRSRGNLTPNYSLGKTHGFGAAAQYVRAQLDLAGPCGAVSTACTSSAKAIASGLRYLRHGLCDAVLVIGVDAICETTVRGFHSLSVLSSQAARPFSRERDGIHIGEAAACLLIERDGDGPVRVASVGESSDAHSMSAPHPEGIGARAAMEQALLRAGLSAHDIGYINAHGTGTEQNDAAESLAIAAAVSRDVPVSSTKGLTGHTLGACGALEAIITALAITRGELPPNAGAQVLDERLPVRVVREPTRAVIRAALSNSFAFGGSNASLVLAAS